ncbi:nitroreductase family protein [Streptomyces sp. XD-27]|uniref:Acg family FMN-binding oxidoreductase n=1 Tax=Streptomyces sp. XD-27 TaxID=3062779 RepID=UPI0026F41CF4|nr:nitroreductase family protein [Streptomyces sp. XD-27]WKX69021.1 nitroreductase family protein [Streptomyces sp. XD-27]
MPERPLEPATVTALVKDATAAPSMHNAQPWRFRFHSPTRTFEIRSDPSRALPRTDPVGRGMHLGCAAALFNLRVAAAHAGWEPVHQLLPDTDDRQLLATVRLTGPAAPGGDLAPLYPAIHRRHTSREPFEETDIPQAVQDALHNAALQEGAQLVFPSAWHVASLLDLVHDAEGRESADPDTLTEVAHWTRIGAAAAQTAADGIPDYAFGPRKWDGKAPVRDFAEGRQVTDRDAARFEQVPHLALLGTTHDEPEDWLRAGQAMERVLLLATLKGLATSLTSHALEWPDLRWSVRDPRSVMAYVQMVLRLGFGPHGLPTPRRPPGDVLDIV